MLRFFEIFENQLVYCQFLGLANIASFLKSPSTPSFLMKFDIWVSNMIIFVLVHGLRGCLVQKFPRNGGQSELKLLDRNEKNFLCNFNHHILQSVQSNFTKNLPHVFIEV